MTQRNHVMSYTRVNTWSTTSTFLMRCNQSGWKSLTLKHAVLIQLSASIPCRRQKWSTPCCRRAEATVASLLCTARFAPVQRHGRLKVCSRVARRNRLPSLRLARTGGPSEWLVLRSRRCDCRCGLWWPGQRCRWRWRRWLRGSR